MRSLVGGEGGPWDGCGRTLAWLWADKLCLIYHLFSTWRFGMVNKFKTSDQAGLWTLIEVPLACMFPHSPLTSTPSLVSHTPHTWWPIPFQGRASQISCFTPRTLGITGGYDFYIVNGTMVRYSTELPPIAMETGIKYKWKNNMVWVCALG